jgi:hypothetical protein
MIQASYDIIEAHILLELRRLEAENDLLKSWVKSGEDVPRCCVCGKPIKGLSLQRMLRPFTWDTRECFEWKPRKIVTLEREYGLDILDILKETSRKYGGLRQQVDALSVSVPYFITIIKKYGGGDYLKFMVEHTTGRRRKGYLRKLNERHSKKPKKRKKAYKLPTLVPSSAS